MQDDSRSVTCPLNTRRSRGNSETNVPDSDARRGGGQSKSPPAETDRGSLGSSLSYLRRYWLAPSPRKLALWQHSAARLRKRCRLPGNTHRALPPRRALRLRSGMKWGHKRAIATAESAFGGRHRVQLADCRFLLWLDLSSFRFEISHGVY